MSIGSQRNGAAARITIYYLPRQRWKLARDGNDQQHAMIKKNE